MGSSITVDVGETLTVVFDFHKELETPWRANYQYATGEFITIGSYVYECTNAGKTGLELPENLTKTVGATQDDGTVEWTCRDFSTSGSDTIGGTSPVLLTVTPSSGITIDSKEIVKNTYVNVTFAADTAGRNTIVCEVITTAGETLRHTYRVFIE